MEATTIILPIKPHTWVKFKSGKGGDAVLRFIPDICERRDKQTQNEKDRGEPCDEWIQTNFCPHTLSQHSRWRKARLDRYNKFREDLFHLAKMAGFELPTCGWSLYFYFPVPKRWTKKDKMAMHGQFHLRKPDQSNLLKAFEDSLSIVDEQVAQMSGLGKFWFNPDLVPKKLQDGYIQVIFGQEIFNPFNVDLQFTNKKVTMTDLATQRKIREEQKSRAKEERKLKVPEKKERILKVVPQEKLFKRKDVIK